MSKAFLIVDLQEQYMQSAGVVKSINALLPDLRERMKLIWVFMGAAQFNNTPIPATDENYAPLYKHLRDYNAPLLRPGHSDFIMTKQECSSFSKTQLAGFLQDNEIPEIFVGGFVDIQCVFDTALQGAKEDFKSSVIRDFTGGVPYKGASPEALGKYRRAGLETISSQELLLSPAN